MVMLRSPRPRTTFQTSRSRCLLPGMTLLLLALGILCIVSFPTLPSLIQFTSVDISSYSVTMSLIHIPGLYGFNVRGTSFPKLGTYYWASVLSVLGRGEEQSSSQTFQGAQPSPL